MTVTRQPLVDYGCDLAPHHQDLLRRSAISLEVAAARGYRTVTDAAELAGLGFKLYQCRVPGLLIPVFDPFGHEDYQIRPDNPRMDESRVRVIKYELPESHHPLIDVHPSQRERIRDFSIPLFITEGVRKADALISQGCCAVALVGGVYGWRGTNEFGGLTTLPDLEGIAFNARRVYITFDSDPVASS